MLIILTGPIGSGKTEVASGLLKVFNNMVFLDCDWFAAMQPFSWDKKSDIALVYEALALMIKFHEKTGKSRFVITLTSQMAVFLSEFLSTLNHKQMPVRAFRLRCNDEPLKLRIQKRNHTNKNVQEVNAIKQQGFFDKTFPTNAPFMLADVTNLNEAEVVRKIRTMINDYEKLLKVNA